MQHPAHVRFVDPHAEGARRDHHRGAVGEKGAQHLAPGARGETRMVGRGPHAQAQQRACDQLGESARRRVHDHRPVHPADQLSHAGKPLAVVPDTLDAKHEIGPIERRDDHLCLRDPEDAEDLGAGAWCGTSRERDGDGIAEQVAVSIEPPIHGAEFVAPLDDAVRFVDGEERHLPAGV